MIWKPGQLFTLGPLGAVVALKALYSLTLAGREADGSVGQGKSRSSWRGWVPVLHAARGRSGDERFPGPRVWTPSTKAGRSPYFPGDRSVGEMAEIGLGCLDSAIIGRIAAPPTESCMGG